MTLSLDSSEVHARFGEICKLLAAERRGLTMVQLRDAHSLARELEADDPDADRVEDLAANLGVDVEALS